MGQALYMCWRRMKENQGVGSKDVSEEMNQLLRMLSALSEDKGSVYDNQWQFTTGCSSSSSGSKAPFWSPQTLVIHVVHYIHNGTHSYM